MWPLLFWHFWAMACHGMPLQSLCQAFATDQRAIDLLQRGKAGWIRIMTLENQKGNCNSNTIVYTAVYRHIYYIYRLYSIQRSEVAQAASRGAFGILLCFWKAQEEPLGEEPQRGMRLKLQEDKHRIQKPKSPKSPKSQKWHLRFFWFRTPYVCESHHSNFGISSRFMKSCLLEELPIIEHVIISSIKSKWNYKIESSNSSWTWIIPSPISPIIFNFVQISGDCIEASTWEMPFPSTPLRRNIAFCGRVPKASLVTWQPMQVVAVFHPIEIWWTFIIEKNV